jgi:hypothetical protein
MHLVREMQRAGVFRMAMPRAWGGPELDFLTQLRVIEALSIADASAGWCTMIGVDGGYMTAYIDQASATFAQLCALELREDDPRATQPRKYERRPEGMFLNTVARDGSPVSTPLTNFTASIVEEIKRNDGVEERRVYRVELTCKGRTESAVVPSKGFDSLGWVGELFGSVPVVNAGQGIKDHARVAIHSGPEPRRREVSTHTGWTCVRGAYQYLDGSGAICGSPEIEVDLPRQLAPFDIPAATREEIAAGMLSSLKLLDLVPDHVSVPLLCCAYRSVLGDSDFGAHIHGHTELLKSELAALALHALRPQLQQPWTDQLDIDCKLHPDDRVPCEGRGACDR